MLKKSIPEIIEKLRAVSDMIAPFNAPVAFLVEQIILDLQEFDKASKVDRLIDRSKKVSEILGPFLKILFEHFNSP